MCPLRPPAPQPTITASVRIKLPIVPLLAVLLVTVAGLRAQSFHLRRPNYYTRTADDNVATELNRRLAAGEVELEWEASRGRLRALLAALAVPESSQTLVFSKTSLQRHRISPKNPRALFFNGDVYIGWIPGAKSLEVAVGDPKLGLAFYTMPQDPEKPPQLIRDDSCLRCHATSRTHDEPGLLLRSVYPDSEGDPIPSAGETNMEFRSPIVERWGGWLVTGQFEGDHRGNGTAVRTTRGNWTVKPRPAKDLTAFADDFQANRYLRPTSDIGALLALEQQATVHNLLIRAAHQMRYLIAKDQVMQELFEKRSPDDAEPTGKVQWSDSTKRIAGTLANEITAALLLDGEAPLEVHRAKSHPEFARDFAALWHQDESDVQLGVLELSQRTFTLPLSPMIHSLAFQRLPDELRQRVLLRMQVAIERGVPPGNVRMSKAVRTTLTRYLRGTVAEWPAPIVRRHQ